MKRLADYLVESQNTVSQPRTGDIFEFEIARNESLISGMIVESQNDSIVIALDDKGFELLESYGYVAERMPKSPMERDADRLSREEFVAKYGKEYLHVWKKALEDAGGELYEGVMSEIDADLRQLAQTRDFEELIGAVNGDMGANTAEYLQNMMQEIHQSQEQQGRGAYDEQLELDLLMDRIVAMYGDDDVPFDADPEGSDLSHDEYGNPIKHPARHLARRGMRQAQGLKEQGDQGNPVARAMLNRILMQHPSMLSQYGVEYVMQAVDDFAEELGPQEEIGTSDVSGWVRALQAELEQRMQQGLDEAEYQGRKVSLGKPFLTPGGPKKRSVYVKNPKGNVVKVNFGDPNMKIKKSDPDRRKSFRARHNCENPGPRHKARYWSCRAW